MADNKRGSGYGALVKQAKGVAMGTHPLSKYVPAALLLVDALLCSLIISRVSCESFPLSNTNQEFILIKVGRRYRNRLESIHGASGAIH